MATLIMQVLQQGQMWLAFADMSKCKHYCRLMFNAVVPCKSLAVTWRQVPLDSWADAGDGQGNE